MASTDGGGEKGGLVERPTHPKPDVDTAIMAAQALVMSLDKEGVLLAATQGGTMEASDRALVLVQPGNGRLPRVEEEEPVIQVEPEDLLHGGNPNPDSGVFEMDLEGLEEEIRPQWTILARYYSTKIPIMGRLFDEMRTMWQLRADMQFQKLDDRRFILTFEAEGDYCHVLRGGPWLHKKETPLVVALNSNDCVDDIPLNFVPMWVRISGLQFGMQTEKVGHAFGGLLGRVREVDGGADGRSKHQFLRVRIEWPVARPLQEHLEIRGKGTN